MSTFMKRLYGRARPVHLLALTALGLRIFRLGAQGLWFDEAYTHFIARMSIQDGLQAMVVDGVHPPLFNWIEKAALLLGDGEAVFRIPSVIFGVVAVVLLYTLAKRWFGERAAFTAGLILTLSPYHLWYSQEARPYAMLAALAVACMLAYVRMLDDPSNWRKAAFVVLSAIAYTTHYFALMLPLIQFAHLLINLRKHWRALRIWTLLQVAAAVPLMIWIGALAQQQERVFGIGWIPESSWPDLAFTLINFSVGYTQPLTAFHWLGLGACVALCALAAGHERLNKERRSLLYLWALLPMALTFLLSLRQPTYVDRFFIGSLPALVLLMALGVDRFRGWRVIPAAVLIGALLVVGLMRFNFDPSQEKEAWERASAHVEDAGEDEAVVVRVLQLVVPLSYYYQGDHPIEAMEVNRAITPLDELAADHSGLWLFYWNSIADAHLVTSDPQFDLLGETDPAAAEWIEGRGPTLIERFDHRGVTVFHFALEP